MSHKIQQLLSQTTTLLSEIILTGPCARTHTTHRYTNKINLKAQHQEGHQWGEAPFLLFKCLYVSLPIGVCGFRSGAVHDRQKRAWRQWSCASCFSPLSPAHRCAVARAGRSDASRLQRATLSRCRNVTEDSHTPGRLQLPLRVEGRNTPSLSLLHLLCHPANCYFSFTPPPPSLLIRFPPLRPCLLFFSSAPLLLHMNPLSDKGFFLWISALHVSVISERAAAYML